MASAKEYVCVLLGVGGQLGTDWEDLMFGAWTNARARVRGACLLFAIAIALVSAAMLAAAGPASAAENPATITSAVQTAPRVIELTISTPAFTTPTKVNVDLPNGYNDDPNRRWPTAYFLAGTQNTYRSFNSMIDGVGLTENFPAIVVSPNGDSGYWSDWYNRGKDGPPMYETYVIEQLIPLIDDYFRTRADRAHRAIAGVSMGGYGALMLAARHPELFGSAASLSGTLNTNLAINAAAVSISSALQGGAIDAIYGPRPTQEVRWRGHNPADLAGNLRDIDLQVRGANGRLNTRIGENPFSADLISCLVEAGAYDSSVSMHGILDKLGVDHLWKDYGAGCHTKPNFQREVTDTLAVFTQNFAAASASRTSQQAPTFDYSSVEPEFKVWGWDIAADPERALEFMKVSDANDQGITLTGSGTTSVTSPPLFRSHQFVRLDGATGDWARADESGRITFRVGLGRAHEIQQYRLGAPSSRTSQTVRFHAWP